MPYTLSDHIDLERARAESRARAVGFMDRGIVRAPALVVVGSCAGHPLCAEGAAMVVPFLGSTWERMRSTVLGRDVSLAGFSDHAIARKLLPGFDSDPGTASCASELRRLLADPCSLIVLTSVHTDDGYLWGVDEVRP
jgi:hypothetical protein